MKIERPVAGTFTTRMMALLFAVVAGIVLLCVGAVAFLTVERVNDQAEQQALGIARTLAADATLQRVVLNAAGERTPDPRALAAGPIQHDAEAVRARTGALFVVVTNDLGIRLSHPNPELLGQRVSTDPLALNGSEFVAREHGTLGESVRAKVPVFRDAGAAGDGSGDGSNGGSGSGSGSGDGSGGGGTAADGTGGGQASRVIGEVSVGVAVETVATQVRQAVLSVVLVGVAALLLAGIAAATLVRWLRRLTLGLEPEEMVQLVRDQEAVLYGVDDGVIGIGPDGRISVRNKAARQMLELARRAEPGDIVGLPYAQAGLPPALVAAIDARAGSPGARATDAARAGSPDDAPVRLEPDDAPVRLEPDDAPVRLELEERVVVAAIRTVVRDGRNLGLVVMLRDLTTLETLGNRLHAVETMAAALRAQRHEFANRLHTISGLLANGEAEHARSYVGEIIESGPVREPVGNIGAVTDPYLRAFLGAKGIQAHERGVALRVGEESALFGTLSEAQDVTAILGNLVDNALQAAVEAPGPGPRWVEVDLLSEGDTLHIAVADSGAGVARGIDVFADGATTRPGADAQAHGHGVGLGLSRRLARLIGGDVWIADPGGGPSTGEDAAAGGRPETEGAPHTGGGPETGGAPHTEGGPGSVRDAVGGNGAVFAARLPGVLVPADANHRKATRHG